MKKRIFSVILTALLAFILCFALTACKDDSCEHEWAKSDVITQPTCSTPGTVSFKCKKCDETKENSTPPVANAHEFGTWIEEIPETCANGTLGHYRCSLCNKYFDAAKNELPGLVIQGTGVHNFVDEICTKCGNEIVYSTGLNYTLSDDGTYYTVSGRGSCKDSNIYIPPKYISLPVKAIGDCAFSYCSDLTGIIIPDSVTAIGLEAFAYCTSLTSITIPDSVTSIGMRAFLCSSLTSITIPDTVTSMGVGAFVYCSALTSVTCFIPISQYAFDGCSELTGVTLGNKVTSIGDGAFNNCTSLVSINIPDSVTGIGNEAFKGCQGLTSITLGKKLASIGDSAFFGCKGLTSIIIPDSVTDIGWYAFSGCGELTSVTIGSKVNSIGSYAFSACKKLTSITFNDTTTWYTTKSYDDWKRKRNGTETKLASDAENAAIFTSAYCDCYWYKR